MPRGGIQELREMQEIANSQTEKIYSGYPTTKQEWIDTLEKWWVPEIVNIINLYATSLVPAAQLCKMKNDYNQIYIILNKVWCYAPDCVSIHSSPGWDVLCDLCSESYLLDK